MKLIGIDYILDKPRTIRFGVHALMLVERETGKNIFQLFATDETEVPLFLRGTETVLKLLLFGLMHEDKELTEEKLIELIDEHSSLMEARTKLGEAFTAALTFSEEKEQPKKKK